MLFLLRFLLFSIAIRLRVQYNFRLHAFRLDGAAYEKGYAAMLDRLAGRSRVVVATSTRALNEARDDDDEAWRVKLAEQQRGRKAAGR